MILQATALLEETPDPTPGEVREAIDDNLCRCTGYQKPVEAILDAADRMHGRQAATDGVLVADPDADVLPMAVIERHGGPRTIGRGFVHNLGLERGAIGTTVAHDAHNCLIAGVSHDAMARVANHLREVGGGIAVYDPAADSFTTVRLPVSGILSDEPLETVRAAFEDVVDAADEIGLSISGGVMELTFLSLEVIPTYKLTNKGLVDVDEGELVDVVLE